MLHPLLTKKCLARASAESYKTDKIIWAVITKIHYLSLKPIDACAYTGTLL